MAKKISTPMLLGYLPKIGVSGTPINANPCDQRTMKAAVNRSRSKEPSRCSMVGPANLHLIVSAD